MATKKWGEKLHVTLVKCIRSTSQHTTPSYSRRQFFALLSDWEKTSFIRSIYQLNLLFFLHLFYSLFSSLHLPALYRERDIFTIIKLIGVNHRRVLVQFNKQQQHDRLSESLGTFTVFNFYFLNLFFWCRWIQLSLSSWKCCAW